MPFVELQTNLAADCFSEDFLKKLSSCAAASLSKPEEVSGTRFGSQNQMTVRGVLEPCCVMSRVQNGRCISPDQQTVVVIRAQVCRPDGFPSTSLSFRLLLQRMNVVVKPGLPMLIAGSCSPCASVTVSAIGATDSAHQNKEHSAKIFEFLSRELGLSEDR